MIDERDKQSIATVPQVSEWKARLFRLAIAHSSASHPKNGDVAYSNLGSDPIRRWSILHHEMRENNGETRCSAVLNKRAGYKMPEN